MKTSGGVNTMAPVVSNKLGEPMALFAVPLPSPGTNEFLCLCKRLFWNVGTSYFSAFCPLTAGETRVLPHSTAIVQLVSVTPAFPADGHNQLPQELLAYTLSGDLVGIPYVAISKNNLPNGKLTKAFPFDDLKSSAWVPALNAPFVGARTANGGLYSAQNVFIIRNDEKTRQSLLSGENVTFSADGKLCTGSTVAGKELVNTPLEKRPATGIEAHQLKNASSKVHCDALKVVPPSNPKEEDLHASLPIVTERTTVPATTPKTHKKNAEQGTMILPRIESVFSLADSSPEECLSKKIADTLLKQQAGFQQGGYSGRPFFDGKVTPKVDSSTQQTEIIPPRECSNQNSVTETSKTSLDNTVIKTIKGLLQNHEPKFPGNPVAASNKPANPSQLKQSKMSKPQESNLHSYFTKVSSGNKYSPQCDLKKSENQTSRVPTSQQVMRNQLTKPFQMHQSKISKRLECDIQNYHTKASSDKSSPRSEIKRSQSQGALPLSPQLVSNQPAKPCKMQQSKMTKLPDCSLQKYTIGASEISSLSKDIVMSEVEAAQFQNSASPKVSKNDVVKLFPTLSPKRSSQPTTNLRPHVCDEKALPNESSHTLGESSTYPNLSASSLSSRVKTFSNAMTLTCTPHTRTKLERNHSQGTTIRELLKLKTSSNSPFSGSRVVSAHSVLEPSRTEDMPNTNRSSPSTSPLTSKVSDEKPIVVPPKEIKSKNILTGDPSEGSTGQSAIRTSFEAKSVNAPSLKMVFKAEKGGSYRVQNAPQPANNTLVIFNGRFPCIYLHKIDISKYMSTRNTPEKYRDDKEVFDSGNQRMQCTKHIEKIVGKEEANGLVQSDAINQGYSEVGAIKERNPLQVVDRYQPTRKRNNPMCRITECETGILKYHLANVHVKHLNIETSERPYKRVRLSDCRNKLLRQSKMSRKQRMSALNVSNFGDSFKVEEGGIRVGTWEPCDANRNSLYETNVCVENLEELQKEKRRSGDSVESDSEWEIPEKGAGDSDWDSSLEDD